MRAKPLLFVSCHGTLLTLFSIASVLNTYGHGTALGQCTITIGSFDDSRSRAPFATESGAWGYGYLRGSLLDPANFGPGGIVGCAVVIAPGTPSITAGYLADKDIFFTSVFTGSLSASEQAAIASFSADGGCVIVEANSTLDEQIAANSLLAAIGTSATLGSGLVCGNSAIGGTITSEVNEITAGPFGTVTGGTFATSVTADVTLDGRDRLLVSCSDGGQARGRRPQRRAAGGLGRQGLLPGDCRRR